VGLVAENYPIGLGGAEDEAVSQHRSPVDLLRFGNDLEGRRKQRPRYRGEHSFLCWALAKLREGKRLPWRGWGRPRHNVGRASSPVRLPRTRALIGSHFVFFLSLF
jgi:hypothetical protein